MAGLIDKAVTRVMDIAGKPNTAQNKAIAKAEVYGAIDRLNAEFLYGILTTSETVTITGGSTGHTVALPVDFASMHTYGFGEYDSATARVKVPWTFRSESYFHNRYRGLSSLSTGDAGSARIWFFVDDDPAGRAQVRVYPSPASSTTAQANYYAKLTLSNIDRLDNETILVDGTLARLPKWLDDTEIAVRRAEFKSAIAALKAQRRSSTSGAIPVSHPWIRRANAVGWGLK